MLADEFWDGNVPARQEPLTCAKLDFAALPETVTQRYFRGDSAYHENELLDWLKHPDREKERGGRIGFAVSACMSQPLAEALREIPDTSWKTFATEEDGTLRQWAEVDFVPGRSISVRRATRCGMWGCVCSNGKAYCFMTGPTGIFTQWSPIRR